jgi:hypothetical protein
MNDTSIVKEMAEAASSQAGWAVALLTATWGIVLRAIVGKHLRAAENTQLRLAAIEQRLAVIEDRSHQRRKGDR